MLKHSSGQTSTQTTNQHHPRIDTLACYVLLFIILLYIRTSWVKSFTWLWIIYHSQTRFLPPARHCIEEFRQNRVTCSHESRTLGTFSTQKPSCIMLRMRHEPTCPPHPLQQTPVRRIALITSAGSVILLYTRCLNAYLQYKVNSHEHANTVNIQGCVSLVANSVVTNIVQQFGVSRNHSSSASQTCEVKTTALALWLEADFLVDIKGQFT